VKFHAAREIFPSGDSPLAGFLAIPSGTEPARVDREVSAMNMEERRLVLDESFERAVAAVLDAFLREGFTVEARDAGDLHDHAFAGDRLRYALLEASLPELSFRPPDACAPRSALLGCRLSLFELTGSCTLITAENPLGRYPFLASLVPRLNERVSDALRLMLRRGTDFAAA
jgi:hypothetical protein